MINNKSKLFDLISWVGLILGFSLADWEHLVYIIIGLISLATTIISGIISIVIKVKHSLKDGKITDDELKDIKNEVDNLGQSVENKFKDKYKDK